MVRSNPFELGEVHINRVLPGVAGAPAGLELSFAVTDMGNADIQFEHAYFRSHRVPLRIQSRDEGSLRLKAFLPDDPMARNPLAEMGSTEERDPVSDSELIVFPLPPGTAYISYKRGKRTYIYLLEDLPKAGKRILQ